MSRGDTDDRKHKEIGKYNFQELSFPSKSDINEYNKELLNTFTNINILTYIKNVNERFFKQDITFMDHFIELINKDEIAISCQILIELEILPSLNEQRKIKEKLIDVYCLKETEILVE